MHLCMVILYLFNLSSIYLYVSFFEITVLIFIYLLYLLHNIYLFFQEKVTALYRDLFLMC